MDFALSTLPATCEAEGQIELNRKNTEGDLWISIDGGNTFDTIWPGSELQINLNVPNGSFEIVIKDKVSDCSVNLGSAVFEAPDALELFSEILQNDDCSNTNGSIRVSFNDNPNYNFLRLSLDDGATFENFDDTLGSVIFENLKIGTYSVVGQWEDESCQNIANAVTITANPDCSDAMDEGPETTETSETPETTDTSEAPDTSATPNTSETAETSEDTDSQSTTDIKDIEEYSDTTLKLYPNPTAERIFVKTDQDEILRLQLFSSTGTLVQDVVPQRENNDTFFMNIAQLQSGVYYLYIYTATSKMLRQVVIK